MALFQRFRSWLGEVLGVELEPTVDISCAKYEHTGENSLKTENGSSSNSFSCESQWFCLFFFFHRRSFVSRRWTGGETCRFHFVSCASVAEQRRGNPQSLHNRWCASHYVCVCLCLRFNVTRVCSPSTGNFQPQTIVKSLVPSWNTLVLFEVSPVSFHQVSVWVFVFLLCKKK